MKTEQKDVNGWTCIKWGMSVAQAKIMCKPVPEDINPAPGEESSKYVTKLQINNFKIGDSEMKVQFETMEGSDVIQEVFLSMPGKNFSAPSSSRAALNEDLLNGLTLKYGKPSRSEHTVNETLEDDTVTWIFPSTVITLQHTEMKLGFGLLHLQYTARNKRLPL